MSQRKDLKNLKVEVLKDELRKKNLPQSGTKAQLIKRLELYRQPKKELQARLKRKNLPITGTKAILVRRIETGKASPPKIRLKEAKRTSRVRCTIGKGKQKRQYYFDPDTGKRISEAEAELRGKENCIPSTQRVAERKRRRKVTPKRKPKVSPKRKRRAKRVPSKKVEQLSERLEQQSRAVESLSNFEGLSALEMAARLQELGEAEQELASLRESAEDMSTTLEDVEETPALRGLREYLETYGFRASRGEGLKQALESGEMEEKDVSELNPKVAADLSRSKEEVKSEMVEESAEGIALVKVGLDTNGTPFLLEIVKEDFTEVPEDPTDLYETYPVKTGEMLATITMDTLNRNRPSRYRPYPTFVSAKPIPLPSFFRRVKGAVGKVGRGVMAGLREFPEEVGAI